MANFSRRIMLASASALLLSSGSLTSASACLNDRDVDKLAEEAKGLPGIVEVITGRFERNPPLYYQMRIEHSQQELSRDAMRYGLYDDIAVAYDRLGDSEAALTWMAKKRQALAGITPDTPAVHEAWYRYYANVGTARVHRWLRAGANRAHLAEVKQARAEIVRALELKPDAHFGRETYQLQIMEWILGNGVYRGADKEHVSFRKKQAEELSTYLEVRDGLKWVGEQADFDRSNEVVNGLAGMIVLGNAWESVDVFDALAYRLDSQRNKSMAELARLRSEELSKKGSKTLLHRSKPALLISPLEIGENLQKRLAKEYPKLRAEAEAWHSARTDYMMTRLQAGRHPDTDPTFWAEWHPAPAPKLSSDADAAHDNQEGPVEPRDYWFAGALTAGFAGLAIAGAVLHFHSRRAR